MSEKKSNSKDVHTAPAETRGGIATRVAATVISALVYGALVYISRFAPRIFGMQLIFPAVAVAPAFGIWWKFWGGLGLVLGTIVSQLPAGLNPMVWVPANMAQALFAFIPAWFYKSDTVKSWPQWLRFFVICAITAAIGLLFVLGNVVLNGFVPWDVALKSLYPVQLVGNIFWMAVVGPYILNTVSPYVVKAGLKFKKFF